MFDRATELKVFISSPGDVASERRVAQAVLERLSNRRYAGRKIRLVALDWESSAPREVGRSAQEIVDRYTGVASAADIYVGIFWRRMGSEHTTRGRTVVSGSRYEFDDAYRQNRWTGSPRMLLYRCTRVASTPEPTDQSSQVDEFFAEFTRPGHRLEGLPGEYRELSEFETTLEADLTRVLIDIARRDPRGALINGVRRHLRTFAGIGSDGSGADHVLPMTFRPAADPVRPELLPPDGTVPAEGLSLLDWYKNAGNRAFFVGEAGSGKTFAMLDLMGQLLSEAHEAHLTLRPSNPGLRDGRLSQDELPVPVYFNLSTWAPTTAAPAGGLGDWFQRWIGTPAPPEDGTLNAWLIDELVLRYSLTRREAARQVNGNRLVFCLDGLDELSVRDAASEADQEEQTRVLRERCVQAINRTLHGRPGVKLILCSRTEVLETLGEKPRLGFPLYVQPLSDEAVTRHLGPFQYLQGLKAAREASPALRERTTNPLFLMLMLVAYHGMSREAILATANEPEREWLDGLLAHYTGACTSPEIVRAAEQTSEQVRTTLTWLAGLSGSDLLLDDIQPSLLRGAAPTGETWSHRWYRASSAVLPTLVLAACVAVPCGLAIAVECYGEHWPLAAAAQRGMEVFAVTGVVTALVALRAFHTTSFLTFGLFIGTAFGLARGTMIGLSPTGHGLGGAAEGLKATLFSVPEAIVVFTLFGYQTLGRIQRHKQKYRGREGIGDYEIQPLESFDWRWVDPENVWRGGWLGLIIGPAIGVSLWPWFGPARGMGFGLVATLIVTVFSGLSGTGVTVSFRPNQGMIRSLRHASSMAVLFSAVGVLAFGASYGSQFGSLEAIVNGLLGLTLAFAFLMFGGIPVLRQMCLGQALHRQRLLPSWLALPPWKPTVTLLDDLVRFKLLRESAGGYMFRHAALKDYFKGLGASSNTMPD